MGDLEAQLLEDLGGSVPAPTELATGGEGPGRVSVRDTEDGLGVVGLAVNNELVPPAPAKTVRRQELVLPQSVVLGDCRVDVRR